MAIFIPVILATALEAALLGIGYAHFKKVTGQFSKPGNASLSRSRKL